MAYAIRVVASIVLAFAVCWVGKKVYALFHPKLRVDHELTARENFAFALTLGAYYFGLWLVMGGALSSASGAGPLRNAFSMAAWGLLAVALLNLASAANRRFVFAGFDRHKAILQDRNLAAGIMAAGSHIAEALIVMGALSGDGGVLVTVVFWAYAQGLFWLTAAVLPRLMRLDLASELRRGNRAAALASSGALVAMGNVLRMAISGDFAGWSSAAATTTAFASGGLVLLFVARELCDRVLLPGVTFHREISELKVPNEGVGWLAALFYLGSSMLIGWCL